MSTESNTASTDLEPIEPQEAARLFYESRAGEVSDDTMRLYKLHVGQFVEWLQGEGYDDTRDVSARTVHEFRLSIKSDVAQATLSNRLSTVRTFLQFVASIDGIDMGVPERVELPKRDGTAKTEMLDPDRADAILDYLAKYAYASRLHATMAILTHTGIRTGTLRALDVSDVDAENKRLRVRHRPDIGCPLKNKESAERFIAVDPDVMTVLTDYVEHNHPDVEDDHGNRPLIATESGRADKSTIRDDVYAATRPCQWAECPEGRDPSECEAATAKKRASTCPETVSGHPVRRYAITRFLRSDVPPRVVSDRMNVSQDVLDEHYDRRSEDEKAEQRRQFLDNV